MPGDPERELPDIRDGHVLFQPPGQTIETFVGTLVWRPAAPPVKESDERVTQALVFDTRLFGVGMKPPEQVRKSRAGESLTIVPDTHVIDRSIAAILSK